MKLKRCLIIISCFAAVFNSFAQQKEFEFKNFTQESGLPSNESYFVYRDSKDFLWFATDQGVVRYNGSKMEKFNLPDNVVFKIREDSKGRIWFFTHTGKLAYFHNGIIYPFKYNDNIAKALKNILILDAYIFPNDEIMINSGIGENIKILQSGTIEKYSTAPLNERAKNTFRITQISNKDFFAQALVVNHGRTDTINIQLTIGGRLINYNIPWVPGLGLQYTCVTTKGNKIFLVAGKGIVRLNTDGSFKTKFFQHVVSSATGGENIWVGFLKHGAVFLDSNLNEIYSNPVLKDKTITSIRNDYEGGQWFSTLEKGVFYLKNADITHYIGDSALAGPVFRLHKPAHDSLLFANTAGIYKLAADRVSLVVKQNANKVNDLFTDHSRNIFLTGGMDLADTLNAIHKRSVDPSFKNVFILTSYSEMVKLGNSKYLSSNYAGLYRHTIGPGFITPKRTNSLNPDTVTLFSKPGVLYYDTNKELWLGTMNALHRVNSTHNSITRFKPADTLFRKGVTAIRQMHNGIYCIGIRFGGLALMQDSGIIAKISEKEGLLDNSIKYLLPLKDQLWVATAKGISVINFLAYHPVKYSITNIGKNDALYNLIIYQLMSHHGKILAATSNGIYEIDQPEKFLGSTPKPIPFYINSITYYKGDTSQVSSITLPYEHNRLVIKYSAVCFNLHEEIKYYYRFSNSDSAWQQITGTELLMENLIPGTYDVQVKAVLAGDRRYSEVQQLKVIIEKPWWQNNWLKLAGILLFIGLVYIYVKKRISTITHREQQNTALHTKMLELEQIALRSQMNPHFIFNCLTSIQQLVITGNKNEANEYLVKFARLIRKTLELSGRSFITVQEETDYLNEYLAMEQLRIPGQFEFSIIIDTNIDIQKTEIPNMMLQPIVENSIRHGIKHLENKKGYITVAFQKVENYILCSISDNGVGRRKRSEFDKDQLSENKSYGMDIVKKRLQALSIDKESLIEVEDLYHPDGSPEGTCVTLRLPYKSG